MAARVRRLRLACTALIAFAVPLSVATAVSGRSALAERCLAGAALAAATACWCGFRAARASLCRYVAQVNRGLADGR